MRKYGMYLYCTEMVLWFCLLRRKCSHWQIPNQSPVTFWLISYLCTYHLRNIFPLTYKQFQINSKLGGTNQDLAGPSRQELTLGQNQTIFSKPIMFVGADVTHPAPDQMGVKPSIAAIVASIDPAVSRYICEVKTYLYSQPWWNSASAGKFWSTENVEPRFTFRL